MFDFNCTNATITAWYQATSLEKTPIGGEPILANPLTPNHSVWLEETKGHSRETEGDIRDRTAVAIGSLLSGIAEGDILTINSQNWRVTSLELPTSILFQNNQRLQQMELTLIRN